MDRGSAERAQRVVATAVGAAAGWRAARRRDLNEREQLEAALTETERSLQRAREAAERLHRSWEAERAWGRDLRSQLHDLLARGRTTTREDDDVHVLVLRAAIELVGAQKGALLSRRDENGDGELDMIVARGFEHDPTHSALAQRFAREVLARDEIVREDEPTAPGSAPPPPGGGPPPPPTTRSTRWWRSRSTCATASRASSSA